MSTGEEMIPFDVFVIETSYLTADMNLTLFLLSFAKFFDKLKQYTRLVICINSGDRNKGKRKSLIKKIKFICRDYNVYIFDCNKEVCEKWRSSYGPNAKPEIMNISHGHAICEYLSNHSKNIEFTLFCHSDIEFVEDMYKTIFDRQKRLIENKKLAAIATWEYPRRGLVAECMDSACSLWKTNILNEYTNIKKIEMGGVDLRNNGGLFYDTGAYVQESIKKDFIITNEPAPVKHWGGITSLLLSRDPDENYKRKMNEVLFKIKEYNVI